MLRSNERPLTVKQTAEHFHVTPWTVYQWIKERKVLVVRTPGGRPRIVVCSGADNA